MRDTASAAASLASALRSAPTYPGVFLAISARSRFPLMRSLRACTASMRPRAASSGIPSMISRSNRPARRKAASMASGRLVAPITVTCFRRGTPPPAYSSSSSSSSSGARVVPPPSFSVSMLASSCATIRLSICLCAPSRLGTIASTSSMNTMLGAAAAAAAKSCLIFCSDSPDTPATISGAAMQKNGTPASRAMACARVVFPHPGGPCSSTPRGGSTPSHVYNSGCVRGHKISSRIARRDSSMPPRSPRRTSRGADGANPPPPSSSFSRRPNGSPGPFPEPPFLYFGPPGR
mmetsp:Transcript_8638/g.36155  ORF Transcript_8638/g.36155 Transcript_8638/m.36155 type:complete len:292 (+) Transcript_8638:1339-2214(+)